MDTKSRNSSKIAGVIVSVLFICVLALLPFFFYEGMEKGASSEREKSEAEVDFDSEKEWFAKMLARGIYFMDWDMENSFSSESSTATEYFLPQEYWSYESSEYEDAASYEEESANTNEEMVERIGEFSENMYNQKNSFWSMLSNYGVEYGEIDSATQNYMGSIGNNRIAAKEFSGYKFYLYMQFDSEGNLTMESQGFSQEELDRIKELLSDPMQLFDMSSESRELAGLYSRIEILKDKTFVYASDKEKFYLSDWYNSYWYEASWYYNSSLMMFAGMAAAAVIGGLLLPFFFPSLKGSALKGSALKGSALKEKAQKGHWFTRLPLEISIPVFLTALAMNDGFLELNRSFCQTISDWNFVSWVKSGEILMAAGVWCCWAAEAGVIYICVVSLRRVFTLGLAAYVKEYSLIVRFFSWLVKKIRSCFVSLTDVDLTDPGEKYLVKIVLINAAILLVICTMWFFGMAAVVIYSIALFIILKNYMRKIKKQYNTLLTGVRQMANGNLDVSMDEDLEIFEPLKKELLTVKKGFKKAVDEEIKSQNMKAELITNVSHDLKTPLTAIITYVKLLQEEGITPQEREEYIRTLDMKSQRLKRLIEDLFEVSKASSGNITMNREEVDLAALLKQALYELDDKIKESGIEFKVTIPPQKMILYLDGEKTYRIFENLIVNIIKYSMPHTRAYINLEEDVSEVRVILRNISATELDFTEDEITERFVRGDKSRNTEGSGLGLAIVKNFVELQGGSFRIFLDGDLFKAVVTWKKQQQEEHQEK